MSDDIDNMPTSVIRAIRDLCPRKGSGVTSIEVSSGGRKVTLTAETRERINRILRERREEAPHAEG